MNCNVAYIPYSETGKFSKLVLDYVEGKDELKPFYENAFDHEGIKKTIESKSSFNYRQELFSILSEQYKSVQTTDAVQQNLKKLQKIVEQMLIEKLRLRLQNIQKFAPEEREKRNN